MLDGKIKNLGLLPVEWNNLFVKVVFFAQIFRMTEFILKDINNHIGDPI